MSERLYTRKYTITVEGETEKWYFEWLNKQINACESRTCNASIDAKVQQSPKKFYKGANAKTTPRVIHICDVESNEPAYVHKFQNILKEMKEAKDQKRIAYILGYSNFTFELWMVLHKRNCNGSIHHRRQYLDSICLAFDEKFEDLDHYKQEAAFERCLNKLTLENVLDAIRRAETITTLNEKDKKTLIRYRGYVYFRENPALSVHEVVKTILTECGVIS